MRQLASLRGGGACPVSAQLRALHAAAAAAAAPAAVQRRRAAPPRVASTSEVETSLRDAGPPAPAAAYVHLPFCKRKCFYCDFPVEAVGLKTDKPRTQERMAAYVQRVCEEIAATAPLPGQAPLQTVSFGGGTPSLVPPPLLGLLLGALRARYGIAPGAEVSLEADPGTFDLPRLLAYKALGVTRLSMGVQSFQQDLLEACGRSHGLADVTAAIKAVQAAAFPSWSLDLISGLPRLSLAAWQASLDAAVAAGPDHVSVYDLQVEEGTPFARWFPGGARPLPAEAEAVAMFEAASATLTGAGYEHYEISNFARPGHRSRHNQVYWRCEPYYAFGLGAASYTRGRRFTRPRDMTGYEAWLAGFAASGGGCPAAHLPPEGPEDRLLDRLMLALRTADGLDLARLAAEFGPQPVQALLPVLEGLRARRLVALARPQQGGEQRGLAALLSGGRACRVRLTDPAGFLLSNELIADLFAALDMSASHAGAAS